MNIDKIDLKPSRELIRASGLTIMGWAKKRGFNYQTVIKVLNNFTGKRRIGITGEIIKRLKKDGFYAEAAAEDRAA